jgi:hypothetical protein
MVHGPQAEGVREGGGGRNIPGLKYTNDGDVAAWASTHTLTDRKGGRSIGVREGT